MKYCGVHVSVQHIPRSKFWKMAQRNREFYSGSFVIPVSLKNARVPPAYLWKLQSQKYKLWNLVVLLAVNKGGCFVSVSLFLNSFRTLTQKRNSFYEISVSYFFPPPLFQIVMESAKEHDTDGDGVIDNCGKADQTYDVWVVTGARYI